MVIEEIQGDLFTAPDGFVKVHCISLDCRMGAGIATEFVSRYPRMKPALLSCNPKIGDSILYKDVINLFTKRRYYDKPTREDFNKSIMSLKQKCELLGITKLALPRLGSGLDRLNWEDSRDHIEKCFEDTNVTIFFYKQ